MTRAEFNSFMAHHRANFRGLDAWFARMGDGEAIRTKEAWLRVLRRSPVGDAVAASDQMMADLDHRPKSFDDHPARIRQLVEGRTESRRNDELNRRYDYGPGCRECNGGAIAVYLYGDALAKARKWLVDCFGDDKGIRMAETMGCITACKCESGDRLCALEVGIDRFDYRSMRRIGHSGNSAMVLVGSVSDSCAVDGLLFRDPGEEG